VQLIKDGARNLWRTIQLSRFLTDDLLRVIDPVIQRNAYFAHPENILLGMLGDDRKHIRQLAARRILRARDTSSVRGNEIRSFTIPRLNLSAPDYVDLINWHCEDVVVTEPPITMTFSEEIVQDIVKTGDVPDLLREMLKFPCHTQSVERCVKLVTEASLAVCGPEARDGFIRARLKARRTLPSFETKKDYKPSA